MSCHSECVECSPKHTEMCRRRSSNRNMKPDLPDSWGLESVERRRHNIMSRHSECIEDPTKDTENCRRRSSNRNTKPNLPDSWRHGSVESIVVPTMHKIMDSLCKQQTNDMVRNEYNTTIKCIVSDIFPISCGLDRLRYNSSLLHCERKSISIVRTDRSTLSPNHSNGQKQALIGSIPLRRATVASIRSNVSASHAPSTKRMPRRVSWSDLHSVSLFDGGRSPTNGAVAQYLWSTDDEIETVPPVFPHVPFDRNNSEIQVRATSVDSISPTGVQLTLDGIEPESATRSDEPLLLPKILPSLGYSLGDPPKHSRHMIWPTTCEVGIEYVSTLQPLDFAFVLCNDGKWTFSIVCNIIMPNSENDTVKVNPHAKGHPLSIRFAVDSRGSTKTICKKNWGHKIRLINVDDNDS